MRGDLTELSAITNVQHCDFVAADVRILHREGVRKMEVRTTLGMTKVCGRDVLRQQRAATNRRGLKTGGHRASLGLKS